MKFFRITFSVSIFLIFFGFVSVDGLETTITIPEAARYETCLNYDNCILPSEVTICVGDTVTWISDNFGSISLQSGYVTKEKNTWSALGTEDFIADHVPSNETFSHTFKQVGTYEYFLTPQLYAHGKIVVIDNCLLSSPLKQFESGIQTPDIQCKNELELIVKATNGNPACVKPQSVEKLIKRGWAIGV